MTSIILMAVIVAGVLGYLFYMKKSGKLGAFQQNYAEAETDMNENFGKYFEEIKKDPDTFKPIVDIIGSDFSAIASCKKPKGILGSVSDTAKTMLTGVVVENTNLHLLVLATNQLHYLEYNVGSQKSAEHWTFDLASISNLEVKKGQLTDNLKQSMSFELRGGGKSGDSINNSDMKKLTFASNEKNYEFFVHDMVGFGKWFKTAQDLSHGTTMSQSKDDIIKNMYMPTKLAQQFFDKMNSININN